MSALCVQLAVEHYRKLQLTARIALPLLTAAMVTTATMVTTITVTSLGADSRYKAAERNHVVLRVPIGHSTSSTAVVAFSNGNSSSRVNNNGRDSAQTYNTRSMTATASTGRLSPSQAHSAAQVESSAVQTSGRGSKGTPSHTDQSGKPKAYSHYGCL